MNTLEQNQPFFSSPTSPTGGPPLTEHPVKKTPLNKRRKNLLFAAVGLVLIILGSVSTYLVAQRSQDLRQRATTAQGASVTNKTCTQNSDCDYNEVCWDNNGSLKGKYCVKNDFHTKCSTTEDCLRAYSTANGEFVYGTPAENRLVCNTKSNFCSIQRFVGTAESCRLRGFAGNLNCNNAWTDFCDGSICRARTSIPDGVGIKINNISKSYTTETEVAPGTAVNISLELLGGWIEGTQKPSVERTDIYIAPVDGAAEQWLDAPRSVGSSGLTTLTWTPSSADAGKTFWVVANSFVRGSDGTKYSYSGNPWCTKNSCGERWQGDMPWSRTKIKVTGATVQPACTLYYKVGNAASETMVRDNGGVDSAAEVITVPPGSNIVFNANGSGDHRTTIAIRKSTPEDDAKLKRADLWTTKQETAGSKTATLSWNAIESASYWVVCNNHVSPGTSATSCTGSPIDKGGLDPDWGFDCGGRDVMKVVVAPQPVTPTKPTVSVNPTTPLSTTTVLDASLTCSAVTGAVRYEFRVGPASSQVTLNIDPASSGSRNSKAVRTVYPSVAIGNYFAACRACSSEAGTSCSAWSDNLTIAVAPTAPAQISLLPSTGITTASENVQIQCESTPRSGATYEFRYKLAGAPNYTAVSALTDTNRNKSNATIKTNVAGAMTYECRVKVGAFTSDWKSGTFTVPAPSTQLAAPTTIGLTPTPNTSITTATTNTQIVCTAPAQTGLTFDFQYKLFGASEQWKDVAAVGGSTRNNATEIASGNFQPSKAGLMEYRCRAKVGTQTSAWRTATFTVPAVAQLSNSEVSITPASLFTVTNNAYISCAPAAGATRYQFQFKRPNGSFANLAAQAAPLADRSDIFNTFDPGVYEYRCRPCTGTGTGDTGCVAWDALSANRGTKSFTSVIPYTAVSISPAQPTTSTTNAVLSCPSVTGATRYQFQVKRPGATTYERIASDSAVNTRSVAFATNTTGVYEYSCRPCYGTGLSDANCKEPWQAYRGSDPLSIATKQVTVGFTYPTVSISPETLNTATTNAKITCGQVPGAVRYEFLYTLENSQQTVAVNPSAAGSRESVTFATPTAGNLIYSCRPCSGTPASTCLGWQVFSDTSTATKKIAVATFTAATPTPAPLPTPITQIVQVPVVTERIVQVPVVTERVVTQPPAQTRLPATAAPVAPAPVAPTESGSEEAPAPTPSELPKAGTVAGTSTAIGVGAILSVLGVIAFLLL